MRQGQLYRRRRRFVAGVAGLVTTAIAVGIASLAAEEGANTPSRGGADSSATAHLSSSAAPTHAPVVRNLYAAITDPRGFAPAVVGVPERVYVPNTVSGTVSVIDPNTYQVVQTIRVGGQPHHISPSWDLRHLYVDNPGLGRLEVIDPRSGKLTRSIKVSSPYNLYFTPDGTKAIVVAEYNNLVEFRDPHTWALIKALHIRWPGVDHLDFSPDGRYLLVSCEYSGVVLRISTEKMAVTGVVHVGGLPIDVKISPQGKVFYVANQGLGGVSVIDPKHLRRVAFIPTGIGAHGFAVSRNANDLYVSNRLGGSISVISFRTRKVVATWHVGGTPDMLQVSPNGKQLWVSNRYGDTVSVISTSTGRVLHVITVGQGPHGLCYFPQPGRFSLGHNGVYR
jgi:YVTN family beta-propeller protein